MNEICSKSEQLLNSIFESAGFAVRASASESELGCLLSIEGADSELLLTQGGELLDALQQILNQALGRSLPKGQRIICDANDYRAAREAELRAMAEHAARQVRIEPIVVVYRHHPSAVRNRLPLGEHAPFDAGEAQGGDLFHPMAKRVKRHLEGRVP